MNTTTVQPDLMLKVDDVSILPSLKKVLKAIPGVTLLSTNSKKSGLDLALEDAKAGRVTEWNCSTEEMFKAIVSK